MATLVLHTVSPSCVNLFCDLSPTNPDPLSVLTIHISQQTNRWIKKEKHTFTTTAGFIRSSTSGCIWFEMVGDFRGSDKRNLTVEMLRKLNINRGQHRKVKI